MRRELVRLLPLGNGPLHGIARGMDDVVRDRVAPNWEDALDLWHFSHLGSHLVGILGVLELDGCTLEQLEAEVLSERGLAPEVVDQGIRVLRGSASGSCLGITAGPSPGPARELTWSSSYSTTYAPGTTGAVFAVTARATAVTARSTAAKSSRTMVGDGQREQGRGESERLGPRLASEGMTLSTDCKP